ncbi:MAG TPA: protein kinase [Ktedonobacteraceae bacterium]|nr:protein kinase [Ktedonobacteraceae bacterium]
MPGLEGTSLGRYRLQRRLGRGGMAEVYLALDERIHREVAIKVVNSSQAEFAERFSREAQAMGNLHHDHLLAAYDYGEQEPWHYLVMPYIEHGTLSDLLKRAHLSLEHAGEILQQVAEALQYAHQHGLIHRDIKPSNILMRDDHYAYLADFGLARALEGSADLTQTGTLLGTPEYMAPELAEGPAGKSSDIYALAVVLYQMISGRVPFHGDTAISTFWKQMREEPQIPSQFNPSISAAVDRVLLRALEKDPVLRYPTPVALSQAYQQALRELDEMPSLYDTEMVDSTPEEVVKPAPVSPAAPVLSPPRAERAPSDPEKPRQAEKLFLPADPVPQILPDARRAYIPVPPPPVQTFEETTDGLAPGISTPPYRLRVRRRRRRGNRTLIGFIMGIIFLLIVSGVLTYLTLSTRQQQGVTATATAKANATNSAITSATQQVVATQQAATAIAAAATARAQATVQSAGATATAVTSRAPVLSDPLSGQDSNNWADDGISCAFQNNAYFVTASGTNTLQPCISSSLQYSNAAFQINVTLISAADAGLIFRASSDGSRFYDFEITNQGQFYLRYRNNGAYTFLIQNTPSSSIKGAGEQNTLLVIANGSTFQLFINGTFVGQTQDSTFSSGQLGVATGTLSSDHGDASFANLTIYSIS